MLHFMLCFKEGKDSFLARKRRAVCVFGDQDFCYQRWDQDMGGYMIWTTRWTNDRAGHSTRIMTSRVLV